MALSSTAVFAFMLIGLVIGIFSGYYVFAVLGGLGVLFGLAFWGSGVFNLVFTCTLGTLRNYSLLAIPLFVFMGHMLDRSGIAKKLFDILALTLGGLRGGLAIASLVISILFAACTGIIGASVVTMGLLFLPAMLERGYHKGMASGVVCAGGTLGILIPPSIMLIVYGPTAGLSVGKLFYAAMGPGLLMGILYIAYVSIACYLKPEMGPAVPLEERAALSTREKIQGLLVNMVPVLALILAVLGVIWFGVAPPTEAAAVGALVAMIIAAAHGTLNFKVIKETVYSTLLTTSMILMIVVCAGVFVGVFTRLGGGKVVQDILLGLPFSKWGVFVCMMAIVFVLGFLMDWIASLLIIVPLFTPIAATLGFDPLWFAAIVCTMYQTSFLTPPFAYAIFYLKGIAPPEVKSTDIMKGVVPFVVIQLITIVLCVVFPKVIMWLPGQMIK
jgi:tripartite ATP-independent transporter DctM subunit